MSQFAEPVVVTPSMLKEIAARYEDPGIKNRMETPLRECYV